MLDTVGTFDKYVIGKKEDKKTPRFEDVFLHIKMIVQNDLRHVYRKTAVHLLKPTVTYNNNYRIFISNFRNK